MCGLDETFRENQNYLNGDKAKATAAYTWRILELSEMKSHLDEIIKNLTPKQLVTDFMTEVLQNPDEWLKNEDSQIGAFISRYMERVFKSDMDRSLQDYLYIKYPRAKGPADLSDCVKDDILKKVYEDSIPMFWNDEDYPILDASVTFQSCSLSVPASASAVCQAADDFRNTMTNCAVRKTGLKDRIFVLRFVSGVPIHAYKGVTLLKNIMMRQQVRSLALVAICMRIQVGRIPAVSMKIGVLICRRQWLTPLVRIVECLILMSPETGGAV